MSHDLLLSFIIHVLFPFPSFAVKRITVLYISIFFLEIFPKIHHTHNTGRSKASKSAKNTLISVGCILTTCSVVLFGKYVKRLMHGQTLWLNDKPPIHCS